MSETLVGLGAGAEAMPTGNTYSCPQCGSFLDAPRDHPHSGDLARKCAACRDWYPVATASGGLVAG
jgi:hypothetical protein